MTFENYKFEFKDLRERVNLIVNGVTRYSGKYAGLLVHDTERIEGIATLYIGENRFLYGGLRDNMLTVTEIGASATQGRTDTW